jgi:two-component system OmpR family sensor kinase
MLIRWKLTIFYTTVLALMLTSFSLVVYWYMSGRVLKDIDRASQQRTEEIVTALSRTMELERARNEGLFRNMREVAVLERMNSLDVMMDEWGDLNIGVRIFHATSGKPVLFSADFLADQDAVPVNYQIFFAAAQGRVYREQIQSRNHGAYYSYSQPVFLANQPWAVVEVLTSMEPYEQTLGQLKQLLVLGTLLATALAFFAGAAVAEAALEPIDSITRTAQQIQRRRDLSRRIATRGPQDEIGRLTSTLNSMLDQIEDRFQRQRRFLGDVSHELRTPLTTIRGEAELMQRLGALDMEGLTAIQDEAERMSRMVNDLLLLVRSDEEDMLDRKPLDLVELLREVLRQGERLSADHHQIELDLEGLPEDEELIMMGDRDRLKQVALNLVSNALSHTPPDTTIRMSLARKGKRALLGFADDGPGIPAEDLPFLFDRFYRVDKARNRNKGGTGLGLAIVQSIVHAHGGDVDVDSSPGKGTRFLVSLPL